jgi:RsiW-degrading membrane proteinase PrsW (M82 family)
MDVWQQMVNAANSWFSYPDVTTLQMLAAVGLAVAFGAVWLAAHWPPLFKRPWLWAIGIVSAFLTMAAFAFVRTPVQIYYDKLVNHFLEPVAISDWLLLLGIPSVLISGLVQEGAKMVPMALYWWKEGRRITPAMGLAIGAAAGAFFGIFESFSVFGTMFSNGWTTAAFGHGFTGIAGFWERFFAIGFHTAVSAMIGYGLARGKGWQYFLVGSGFHALFNYPAYFYVKHYIGLAQVETIIAVIAVILTVVVLIVRYRLRRDFPDEAAYDADQYLEYEEEMAAAAAAGVEAGGTDETASVDAGAVAPPEEPPAPESEEKPD